jgi:hypothetical protein
MGSDLTLKYKLLELFGSDGCYAYFLTMHVVFKYIIYVKAIQNFK